MKKIFFFVGLAVLIALIIWSVTMVRPHKPVQENGRLSVVATLFPTYDFVKVIGGDKVAVTNILPAGVEPHAFEPTPSDVAEINEADVFVYTGEFMEPWAADVIKGAVNDELIVVDSSAGITLIPAVFHDEDEPEGSMDPHIWLDFDNAKIMTANIAEALQKADPDNAEYYQTNLDNYFAQFTSLDNEYQEVLSACQSKTIVYGGHYAFGYLAKRFGLEYEAAQGISPDAEPSAQDMIALVNQIKADNIKYVFYEELTSPKIAETLADETGTELLLLNGAHNVAKEDYENGVSYLSIMRDNLENLALGLDCQK